MSQIYANTCVLPACADETKTTVRQQHQWRRQTTNNFFAEQQEQSSLRWMYNALFLVEIQSKSIDRNDDERTFGCVPLDTFYSLSEEHKPKSMPTNGKSFCLFDSLRFRRLFSLYEKTFLFILCSIFFFFYFSFVLFSAWHKNTIQSKFFE